MHLGSSGKKRRQSRHRESVLAFSAIAGLASCGPLIPIEPSIGSVTQIPSELKPLQIIDPELTIENTSVSDVVEIGIRLETDTGSITILPLGEVMALSSLPGAILATPRAVVPLLPEGTTGTLSISAIVSGRECDPAERPVTILRIPSETEPNGSRFDDATIVMANQGFAGTSSDALDDDWYVVDLPPDASVGVLADGVDGPVSIEAYVGSDGTPVASLTTDGFGDRLRIDNHDSEAMKIYVKILPDTIQDYHLLLENMK
ncbi:MAG: hypothetical protein JXA15_11980 [Spirochaetales bacterium]|nr:hypothetical protein [Spirochaetales bacterium]